jgi:hypothetical protein
MRCEPWHYAFYSVDEVKSVGEGIFPENRFWGAGVFSWIDSLFLPERKMR